MRAWRTAPKSGANLVSLACAWSLAALVGLGCEPGNLSPGVEPPDDELFFPQGMLLDPRVAQASQGVCTVDDDCATGLSCAVGVCREPARWLIVANANSDLTYNAGTLVPFDLDGLFASLADPDQVGAASSTVSASQPCRRAELEPQLIECDETYYAAPDASVHYGAFAMQPGAWDCEVIESSPAPSPGEPRPQRRIRYCGQDEAMLLTPINGDPSVTYSYLSGGLNDDDIAIECGQGSGSGQVDKRRCSDDFRIRYYRNESDSTPLPRELTTMQVVSDAHTPWAFVTHRARAAMSLLKLDGLQGGRDEGSFQDPYGPIPAEPEMSSERPKPAFVDFQSVFSGLGGGGFGLAERPCDPLDPPSDSNECTRPLMYAGYRQAAFLAKISTTLVDPADLTTAQDCLVEGAVPEAGEVDCDPKLLAVDLSVAAGGLVDSLGGVLYGDIAFSQDGEELYMVQSAPGALIRINTGVDALGRTIDEPNAFVELCDRPSSLLIYNDGLARYGLTTCYRSALVYVIDLDTMTVVRQLRAGTGPNRLIADLAREVVYVANTLDATISVIDMSRDNQTRFTQVARLGLQEPYDP